MIHIQLIFRLIYRKIKSFWEKFRDIIRLYLVNYVSLLHISANVPYIKQMKLFSLIKRLTRSLMTLALKCETYRLLVVNSLPN